MEYSGGGGEIRKDRYFVNVILDTHVLLTPTSRKNHVNLKYNYNGSTEHHL